MGWKAKFACILLLATAWSVYHEHYVGDWKRTINIDGIGYNAYLPALFIHDGNLSWDCYHTVYEQEPVLSNRLQDFRKPTHNGHFVNKYPPGLAVTQLPFWMIAWGTTGFSHRVSGLERPFEIAVFANNLFWLFAGLWFLMLLLLRKNWPPNRALLAIGILLFSTNLFHFITFDNSLTHSVSLGFSLMALYLTDVYAEKGRLRLLWGILFLIMVLFWLRPVNVLMVPFLLMFLFFRTEKVKTGYREVLSALLAGVAALLFYFGDIKLQTGNWLVYSYGNETFVFTDWRFDDVLFGYRCGWFLYTPVLLAVLFFWFRNENKKLVTGYTIWFLITIWFISTWNEYCYGCRLGNRPMIDYLGFFLVPAMGARYNAGKKLKTTGLIFLLFCTYYNQILHYQYRHYLLDWCDVKKEQFWQVFLRTHRPH